MMEEDNNSSINNQIDAGPQIEVAEEKKKMKKGPIIAVLVIVILGLLGYFVIYPYVKETFIDTPQKVFETSIDYLNREILKEIDDTTLLDSIFHEYNVKLSTNINDLKPFENYTYGIKAGIDKKNKNIEAKAYILNSNDKEYSATGYIKNNILYYKLSTDDRLFKALNLNELNIDLADEIIKASETIDKEDTKYLVNKIFVVIKQNFNKDDFSKENATIKVNGNQRTVVKNTYTLTIRKIYDICKNIANSLYNDQKAMDILEKYGIKKENLKELIDKNITISDEDNKEIKISIYTSNSKFAGFDIKAKFDEEASIYYYTINKDFEAGFIESNGKNMIINGVQKDDKKEITIKVNNETYGTLNISKWSKEEIALDYNIKIPQEPYNLYGSTSNNPQEISGSFEVKTPNKDQKNKTIILNIKYDTNNLTLTMNYKEDKNSKIADVNESLAKELDETEAQTVAEKFVEALMDTPLKSIIESTYSSATTLDPTIDYSNM